MDIVVQLLLLPLRLTWASFVLIMVLVQVLWKHKKLISYMVLLSAYIIVLNGMQPDQAIKYIDWSIWGLSFISFLLLSFFGIILVKKYIYLSTYYHSEIQNKIEDIERDMDLNEREEIVFKTIAEYNEEFRIIPYLKHSWPNLFYALFSPVTLYMKWAMHPDEIDDEYHDTKDATGKHNAEKIFNNIHNAKTAGILLLCSFILQGYKLFYLQ